MMMMVTGRDKAMTMAVRYDTILNHENHYLSTHRHDSDIQAYRMRPRFPAQLPPNKGPRLRGSLFCNSRCLLFFMPSSRNSKRAVRAHHGGACYCRRNLQCLVTYS